MGCMFCVLHIYLIYFERITNLMKYEQLDPVFPPFCSVTVPLQNQVSLSSLLLIICANTLMMGENRNMSRLLVGKPKGKRPLGRPRHKWIDNIKMALLEIGLGVVD
jgi:hypothetical protein